MPRSGSRAPRQEEFFAASSAADTILFTIEAGGVVAPWRIVRVTQRLQALQYRFVSSKEDHGLSSIDEVYLEEVDSLIERLAPFLPRFDGDEGTPTGECWSGQG